MRGSFSNNQPHMMCRSCGNNPASIQVLLTFSLDRLITHPWSSYFFIQVISDAWWLEVYFLSIYFSFALAFHVSYVVLSTITYISNLWLITIIIVARLPLLSIHPFIHPSIHQCLHCVDERSSALCVECARHHNDIKAFRSHELVRW